MSGRPISSQASRRAVWNGVSDSVSARPNQTRACSLTTIYVRNRARGTKGCAVHLFLVYFFFLSFSWVPALFCFSTLVSHRIPKKRDSFYLGTAIRLPSSFAFFSTFFFNYLSSLSSSLPLQQQPHLANKEQDETYLRVKPHLLRLECKRPKQEKVSATRMACHAGHRNLGPENRASRRSETRG